MDISIDEIMKAFDHLQKKSKTREEVSDWALRLMRAEDAGDLRYMPSDQEAKIWKAIIWLTGIDLKEESDSYFDTDEGIQEYRDRLLTQM